MSHLKVYIRLLRVNQWVKNLFIFIPVFFSAELYKIYADFRLIGAFVCFAFASSAMYIINDLKDAESDKRHPVKKLRPYAAGEISYQHALALSFLLLSMALLISYFIMFKVFLCILIYLFLNVLYTYFLKEISIVDILIISFGFLVRIITGGIAADVKVSKWLILMIFLLSLTLALGKRRDDLILNPEGKLLLRPSLKGYTIEFIDASIILLSVISIVSYILYTVSDEVIARFQTDYIYITAFPVIIAFIRYLQCTFVFKSTGSPTNIFLRDRFIQTMIVIWAAMISIFIYGIEKA